jgi:hypothetical protein
MTVARAWHTATLLPSGKVLIAGGSSTPGQTASAELYNPATGTFTATGNMTVARVFYAAALLPSGKVLVTGGEGDSFDGVASAELYDPAAGAFTATGNMTVARHDHTATLLGNGKVLIAGGVGGVGGIYNLASAELYDPGAGRFTATASMTTYRADHTATLLGNGEVLVAGGFANGWLASAELYDPAAWTFTATGSMAVARQYHTATLLLDGKVLIVGGTRATSGELYE